MSCFFPSGVSAMINESPPCPGRINGFTRLKTILAPVGQQKDSVLTSNGSVVAASTLPHVTRFIAEELCCYSDFALILESAGGGFDGLGESRRQARFGSRGIRRGRSRHGSGQMGRLATQPSPRDRGVRRGGLGGRHSG